MCLKAEWKYTKKFNGSKKLYTFYKIFYKVKNKLYTPFQFNLIKKYGIIEAKGIFNIENNYINGGVCHAFKTYDVAYDYFSYEIDLDDSIIIPIQVWGKDIVAAGKNDVCFWKYRILKKDWPFKI